MDRIDPGRRSENMRRVKGANTGPELAVRRALHAMGRRFRLHRRNLPGRPDIILPKDKIAIFVHGCFWHRHIGCRRASTPSTRLDFWGAKFKRTIERDAEQTAALQQLGWRVEVVWECETRPVETLTARLLRLLEGN